MVIFYDDKVDYCRVTTDDSEISPMIRNRNLRLLGQTVDGLSWRINRNKNK